MSLVLIVDNCCSLNNAIKKNWMRVQNQMHSLYINVVQE